MRSSLQRYAWLSVAAAVATIALLMGAYMRWIRPGRILEISIVGFVLGSLLCAAAQQLFPVLVAVQSAVGFGQVTQLHFVQHLQQRVAAEILRRLPAADLIAPAKPLGGMAGLAQVRMGSLR